MDDRRRWRAITLGTLVLVPAFWALLIGAVSDARDGAPGAPNVGIALAFGIAIVPFVFVVVAFASRHPAAPGAALRAMGLALLVGPLVAAMALDAVSGIVAGVGAGGAVALRRDESPMRARAVAVAVATVYAFIVVRIAGGTALLIGPVLPLTSLGLADELWLWRARRSTDLRPTVEG